MTRLMVLIKINMKQSNISFIIEGEVFQLLSVMKPANQWTSNAIKEYQLNPHVKNLENLRQQIIKNRDSLDKNIDEVLWPILNILTAENVPVPVKKMALDSITKLLRLGLVDPSTLRCPKAVQRILLHLSDIKLIEMYFDFDAIFMKILDIFKYLFSHPCGYLLSNDNIRQIKKFCLCLCFNRRVSNLVREEALSVLEKLMYRIFDQHPTYPLKNHAQDISLEDVEASLEKDASDKMQNLSAEANNKPKDACEVSISKTNPTLITEPTPKPHSERHSDNILNISKDTNNRGTTTVEPKLFTELGNPQEKQLIVDTNYAPKSEDYLPYRLPFLVEILSHLVSLIDPINKNSSDYTIAIGLRLIAAAIESGVDYFASISAVMSIVKDKLCKNLLLLLRKDENKISTCLIQVNYLLFEALRSQLKRQFEMYLSTLGDIVTSSNSEVTYKARELALEGLVQIWTLSGVVTEMYLNYDCDINSRNLLEETISVLQRVATPDSDILPINTLAFKALMSEIDEIQARCRERANSTPKSRSGKIPEIEIELKRFESRQRISYDLPTPQQISASIHKKRLFISAAKKFNLKPTSGIHFLQEQGILSTPLNPNEVVMFLRNNSWLEKNAIGEYLNDQNNFEMLNGFLMSFDFSNKRIDVALRECLEYFSLPRVSQDIQLFCQVFAKCWCKSTGELIAVETATRLAIAIITLEKNENDTNCTMPPMTKADFVNDLKGANVYEDLDQEMLNSIYNAITHEEIRMPMEKDGIVKKKNHWKEPLRENFCGLTGNYFYVSNGFLDCEIFQMLVKGLIGQTLFLLWKQSVDKEALDNILEGFNKCFFISDFYNMTEIIDFSLNTMSKFVFDLYPPDCDHSCVALAFGRDIKKRMALEAYFSLVRRYSKAIRAGWTTISMFILRLYNAELLSNKLLEIDGVADGTSSIQTKPPELKQQTTWSLKSIFFNDRSQAYQLSQLELDTTRAFVKQCRIEEFLDQTKLMEVEALVSFIKAIIRNSPRPGGNAYSEIITGFFMGLLSKIVAQNGDRASHIVPVITQHLHSLIIGACASRQYSLLQKSVNALFHLAIHLILNADLTSTVLNSLTVLLEFKEEHRTKISETVIYGLDKLLKTGLCSFKEQSDWTILLTLMEFTGAGASLSKMEISHFLSDRNEDQIKREIGHEPKKEWSFKSEAHSLGQNKPSQFSPDDKVSVSTEKERAVSVPLNCISQDSSDFTRKFFQYDHNAFIKSVDLLQSIVQNQECVSHRNYDLLVHCCHTFVEVCLSRCAEETKVNNNTQIKTELIINSNKTDENEDISSSTASMKMVNILFILFEKIIRLMDIDSKIWEKGLCPTLQILAKLCFHSSNDVKKRAKFCLQQALLLEDLKRLNVNEWESSFNHVFFPLSEKSLDTGKTGIFVSKLLSTVFLRQLSQLITLPNFTILWQNILELMEKFSKIKNERLSETIPELVKNMFLVLENKRFFQENFDLRAITLKRIAAIILAGYYLEKN